MEEKHLRPQSDLLSSHLKDAILDVGILAACSKFFLEQLPRAGAPATRVGPPSKRVRGIWDAFMRTTAEYRVCAGVARVRLIIFFYYSPQAMQGDLPGGKAECGNNEFISRVNTAIMSGTYHPYNFLPFIGACALYKEKTNIHVQSVLPDPYSSVHALDDLFPFVPYRENSMENLTSTGVTKKVGDLEWLSSTNGQVLYGFYNSIDIYTALQLGFSIKLVNYTWPIVWEKWASCLGECYAYFYTEKCNAKKAGNAYAADLYKLIMNSSIGKFAQVKNVKLMMMAHLYY